MYWQRLHWEYYHFYRMKQIFLTSNRSRPHPSIDMSFPNFRYIDYLESATTHLFVKMIHVGWRIWATGIVIVGCFAAIFSLLMYSHESDSLNLANQLDKMWLDGDANPPQRAGETRQKCEERSDELTTRGSVGRFAPSTAHGYSF